MGVIGWTWLLLGASFALFVTVALVGRARSTAELYVAEGTVHPAVNGMATASDWISAASFMSVAGVIAFSGRDGAAYLMGWTGGYVLLAVLLAPYLRKWGKYTVPQFVGERYYSTGARVVATVCALLISFTYVAAQVRGVGIVLSGLLGVPIGAAVALAVVAVFLYAVLGGLKGVTPAQVAQYVFLVLAFVVPAALVSAALTGTALPPLGLGEKLTAEGAARRVATSSRPSTRGSARSGSPRTRAACARAPTSSRRPPRS
jgi:cation/acetate symporter